MNVDVATRGAVSAQDQTEAVERVSALEEVIATPVLASRVVLTNEPNPRIERPARAEGELVLQGRAVHARVAAETMEQAVRELVRRLETQARQYVQRMTTLHRRPGDGRTGEWHHGDWSAPRPEHFPRDPSDREVLRRKSFAMEAQTEAEAAADLAALDHEFFLFADADTGADAVLYRREDGRLALIEPAGTPAPPHEGPIREPSRFSGPISVDTAVAEMNELHHRFLFFVDEQTGRGAVMYLRYDGHYGLIEPAGRA